MMDQIPERSQSVAPTRGKRIRTGENPRSLVDENRAKGFGVVGFEALDHEFHRSIIHVGQGEVGHIKDKSLDSSVQNKSRSDGDLLQSQSEERGATARSQ